MVYLLQIIIFFVFLWLNFGGVNSLFTLAS